MEVDPRELTATQKKVGSERVISFIQNPNQKAEGPELWKGSSAFAAKYDGKLYVIDGHHRAAAAYYAGRPLKIQVVDMNQVYKDAKKFQRPGQGIGSSVMDAADARLKVKKGFNPDQPRVPAGDSAGGQFGSTGEGPSKSEDSKSGNTRRLADEATHSLTRDEAKQMVRAHAPDAVQTEIDEGEGYEFTVGSVGFKAAGQYDPGRDVITLYEKSGGLDDRVVIHEITHAQFERVAKQYSDESYRSARDDFQREIGGNIFTAQRADGSLRPEYADKYPTYAAMSPYWNNHNELKANDGVTEYSKSYWDALNRGDRLPKGSWTAVNETMAELAAVYITDKKAIRMTKFHAGMWKAFQSVAPKGRGYGL